MLRSCVFLYKTTTAAKICFFDEYKDKYIKGSWIVVDQFHKMIVDYLLGSLNSPHRGSWMTILGLLYQP